MLDLEYDNIGAFRAACMEYGYFADSLLECGRYIVTDDGRVIAREYV